MMETIKVNIDKAENGWIVTIHGKIYLAWDVFDIGSKVERHVQEAILINEKESEC